MTGQLTNWQDIRRYVFAGTAVFTLRSVKTGARYTYRVRMPKKAPARNPSGAGPYYASLLNGPDNGADYCYMGVVNVKTYELKQTLGSRVKPGAPSHVALSWFLHRMQQGGEPCGTVEFWHEGRCGRCGRALTVPESLACGLGPECAGR